MKDINIYASKDEAIASAAGLFTRIGTAAIKERGSFHVMLSGGETPRQLYELLAQNINNYDLPWGQVHVYWGDERCVPPEHLLSNQQMTRQALLNHVNIPEKNIHPIVYDVSPEHTAKQYEKHLRSLFDNVEPQFDLILLGLGDDGHTASLFPSTAVLHVEDKWVSPVHLPEQDVDRITLTFPILNKAKNIAFLVTGGKKASAVKAVLEAGSNGIILPASLIKPVAGHLSWILDQDAATLLHIRKEL